MNTMMDVLWQIVYWGNLLQGSFVTKFFQRYWVSGHFSLCSRIRATLKQFLIMIIVSLIVLIILGAILYHFLKDYLQREHLDVGKTIILIMSNVYGTLVLVILLSYGLAFLPFSVWKRADNNYMVFEHLMNAD